MPIHSTSRCWNTFHAFHVDVEWTLYGGLSLNHDITSSSIRLRLKSQGKSTPYYLHRHTLWGWTHLPIHSISRCLNTLYTYHMDVDCTLQGVWASTMALHHQSGSGLPQNRPKNPPLTSTGNPVWGWTHMPINSMSRCLNTMHTYHMDVEYTPRGVWASTMALHHHSGSGLPPNPPNPPLTCTGVTL